MACPFEERLEAALDEGPAVFHHDGRRAGRFEVVVDDGQFDRLTHGFDIEDDSLTTAPRELGEHLAPDLDLGLLAP